MRPSYMVEGVNGVVLEVKADNVGNIRIAMNDGTTQTIPIVMDAETAFGFTAALNQIVAHAAMLKGRSDE